MNSAPTLSFDDRQSAWESLWSAYANDPTPARWDAMDAWCERYNETNPIEAPAPFAWHAKPAGGGPCPVCGCAAKRLRATHRATTTAERTKYPARYIKSVKVCFGTDSDVRPV